MTTILHLGQAHKGYGGCNEWSKEWFKETKTVTATLKNETEIQPIRQEINCYVLQQLELRWASFLEQTVTWVATTNISSVITQINVINTFYKSNGYNRLNWPSFQNQNCSIVRFRFYIPAANKKKISLSLSVQ